MAQQAITGRSARRKRSGAGGGGWSCRVVWYSRGGSGRVWGLAGSLSPTTVHLGGPTGETVRHAGIACPKFQLGTRMGYALNAVVVRVVSVTPGVRPSRLYRHLLMDRSAL